MSAAAVIVASQNRYLRAFQRAGATGPETACSLADLGLRESLIFRGLLRRGYIVEAPGGYYVNLARVAERRRRARILAIVSILAVMVCLAAFGLFKGR